MGWAGRVNISQNRDFKNFPIKNFRDMDVPIYKHILNVYLNRVTKLRTPGKHMVIVACQRCSPLEPLAWEFSPAEIWYEKDLPGVTINRDGRF